MPITSLMGNEGVPTVKNVNSYMWNKDLNIIFIFINGVTAGDSWVDEGLFINLLYDEIEKLVADKTYSHHYFFS